MSELGNELLFSPRYFFLVVVALFSSGLCADFHRLVVVGKIPSEHIQSKSNGKFCDGLHNSSIKIRTLFLHVGPGKPVWSLCLSFCGIQLRYQWHEKNFISTIADLYITRDISKRVCSGGHYV